MHQPLSTSLPSCWKVIHVTAVDALPRDFQKDIEKYMEILFLI